MRSSGGRGVGTRTDGGQAVLDREGSSYTAATLDIFEPSLGLLAHLLRFDGWGGWFGGSNHHMGQEP